MKKILILPNGRRKVVTINDEKTMTDESFKNDCDVNNIVERYLKTKDVSMLRQKAGMYADVSEIPDLGEALMQVQEAQHAFMNLPAKLRKKFGNDPENMIEFLQDPSNDEEAIKLGLKVKTKPDTPSPLPTQQTGDIEPQTSNNTQSSQT